MPRGRSCRSRPPRASRGRLLADAGGAEEAVPGPGQNQRTSPFGATARRGQAEHSQFADPIGGTSGSRRLPLTMTPLLRHRCPLHESPHSPRCGDPVQPPGLADIRDVAAIAEIPCSASPQPVGGVEPERSSSISAGCFSGPLPEHSHVLAACSLGPFVMWPVLPASDYYGPSAPSPVHRPTAGLPSLPPWPGNSVEKPGWFPRSPCTFRWGRCPAFPLQPCHEYAAGLPRGLRVGDIIPARSRLAYLIRSARAADRPTSTRFEPAKALEGVQPLVHTCYAFPSCSPDPRRLAVPAVRLCRGCLLPEPALPGSGLSQLHRPAATG